MLPKQCVCSLRSALSTSRRRRTIETFSAFIYASTLPVLLGSLASVPLYTEPPLQGGLALESKDGGFYANLNLQCATLGGLLDGAGG